jgi:hypothetical protein
MQYATYTAIDFCKVGSCALLKGVQHPDGIGPDVVTTPVRSYYPSTGVIETLGTRYTKATAPAKLYKPTHGGYPG